MSVNMKVKIALFLLKKLEVNSVVPRETERTDNINLFFSPAYYSELLKPNSKINLYKVYGFSSKNNIINGHYSVYQRLASR